ncbi:MAG: nucleotidyltransferase domain-containing protein [Muribaculaceae bacterium]|nr:nucleotidyltransferase domain-containing protein [Muribaculaceae bacterium]
MPYGLTEIELSKLIAAVAETPEVEEIILYGSRARGNHRRFSDIDLTLTGINLERKHLYRILERIDDLYLPYEIDLSILAEIDHPPLLEEIHSEGIRLYP